MSLQQIRQQIEKLSIEDKLKLINELTLSLKDISSKQSNKKEIIKKMRGFLKTDNILPDEHEIKSMLRKHKEEKYLQ